MAHLTAGRELPRQRHHGDESSSERQGRARATEGVEEMKLLMLMERWMFWGGRSLKAKWAARSFLCQREKVAECVAARPPGRISGPLRPDGGWSGAPL